MADSSGWTEESDAGTESGTKLDLNAFGRRVEEAIAGRPYMRAMALMNAGEPLRLVERPDPEPGPGEARPEDYRGCDVIRYVGNDLEITEIFKRELKGIRMYQVNIPVSDKFGPKSFKEFVVKLNGYDLFCLISK